MSVSKEMYIQTDHKGRTLETLKTCSQYPPSAATDKRLGSIESPLLDIEIDHVVPDELHLLLQVTDILIRNLIFYMKKLDVKARSGNQHVNNLVTKVRECGISFQIWEARDADGRTTGKLECTSLMGNDKKRLLEV